MGVSVLSKHGQRSLRSVARASVLGDGLLERTRSTSLALLGVTAAIGLAMVALALNQDWPLIAGAPIPGVESKHQAVGDATVAATARGQGRSTTSGATNQASPGVSSGKPGPRPSRTTALVGSQTPQTAGLVAAHPTPRDPAGGSPASGPIPDPAPVAQQPAPAPEPAAAAVPVASSASPPPGQVAQTTPEAPIPSQTPPATDEGDEHDHGHHSGGGTNHGHGHGHSGGGEDSDTPESSESPETAPTPGETPPPEADAPDESDDGQAHAPSWGHGGGHGYGHGHW
ncbi:MAG TPA: hypothetical protein VK471_07845 [Solirubrobacterales bacterium]|nr:hypothetical protein [Solirubrobacterales bacterium]